MLIAIEDGYSRQTRRPSRDRALTLIFGATYWRWLRLRLIA